MRRLLERLRLLCFGVCAAGLIVACDASESSGPPAPEQPASPSSIDGHFVGAQTCARCHPTQAEAWRGSHHDLAMQEATPDSVLGRFDASTFSRDGETWRFLEDGEGYVVELDRTDHPIERLRVAYTFGVDPLQQYLVPRSKGRYQALPIAWDARPSAIGGQAWIDLQAGESAPPGDPLHWEELAYNWNSQCASCHSTDLAKGYDPETGRFETRWAEIDVGCEACHGAGSGHVALRDPAIEAPEGSVDLAVGFESWSPERWVRRPGAHVASRAAPLGADPQLDVCAPCHSRRSQIVETVTIGAPFLDAHRPALLEPGLYFEDGQIRDEVYVWGSFLQSRMHAAGVRCDDCHDPHSLSLRREGNALCTGCHDGATYDLPEHHGHPTGARGSACVDCHMPSRVYMRVDARRDHSFSVPRPRRSALLGAPNACSGCHADREPAWATERIASWRQVDAPAVSHWSDRLLDGDRVRDDWQRWASIALDPDLPSIVRASAWARVAEEADSSSVSSLLSEVRARLREGSELERLALIELALGFPPEQRVTLLRPLLEDPRLAIRVEAAEGLSAAPASAFRPDDRAVLARALREHRGRLLANAERPESQVGLGTLAIRMGEPETARAAYRRAIELAPYFVPAYVNLADLERMLGRDAEAVEQLQRAIGLAPEDPMVRYAYGLALHRTGRTEEALAELERAATSAPDEPRLVLAWALALDGAGRPGDAIDVLEAAIDRGARSDDLHYALVTLLRDRGELARSRARAEAWRRASPADPRPAALLRELESSRAPGRGAPGAP